MLSGGGAMELEGTVVWPEIVQKLNAMSLKELASLYGVTPGAISAAMVRTGCRRHPVRHVSAETPRWMRRQAGPRGQAARAL